MVEQQQSIIQNLEKELAFQKDSKNHLQIK